jgi:hypothetical protein
MNVKGDLQPRSDEVSATFEEAKQKGASQQRFFFFFKTAARDGINKRNSKSQRCIRPFNELVKKSERASSPRAVEHALELRLFIPLFGGPAESIEGSYTPTLTLNGEIPTLRCRVAFIYSIAGLQTSNFKRLTFPLLPFARAMIQGGRGVR